MSPQEQGQAPLEIDEIPMLDTSDADQAAGAIDPVWASNAFGFAVKEAAFVTDEETNLDGGKVGLMRKLKVITDEEEGTCTRTFIVKTKANPGMMPGLAREAKFYNEMGERFKGKIPKCIYARGDMSSGRKILVLEDLSAGTVSGQLVGASHPYAWGMKDEVERKTADGPGAEEVIRKSFTTAAELHAQFWNIEAVQDLDWIQGRRGVGREAWEANMEHSRALWRTQREGVDGITLTPNLVAVMDASMARISWDDYQARIESLPFTLIQGDFHPFNVMWMDDRVVLYDWEMVSVGSPGQELGQYMMNIGIDVRRACEKRLVTEYYEKLVGYGVSLIDLPFETFWEEYVFGGSTKWIWLLPILLPMFPNKREGQWFCDQMDAFFKDHGVTAENVQQPRM